MMEQSVCLPHNITEQLKQIWQLFRSCYGPNGLKTLVVSDTGKILVTKNGMTLLGIHSFSHPVSKLVVSSVKKHHEFAGDGSKSMLLLVYTLFKILTKNVLTNSAEHMSIMRVKYCQAFRSLLCDILPVAMKSVLEKCYRLQQHMCYSQDVYSLSCSIIKTYLEAVLSDAEALHLSKLLAELLKCSCQKSERSLLKTVYSMISNFKHLTSDVIGKSVVESYLVCGTIISREFKLFPSKQQNLRFVLLGCLFERDFEKERKDISAACRTPSSVDCWFHFMALSTRQLVQSWSRAGVDLIISSQAVSETALGACKETGIGVIHHVDQEYLEYLEKIANVEMLHNVDDFDISRNVGKALKCQQVFIGGFKCVNIVMMQYEDGTKLMETEITNLPKENGVDSSLVGVSTHCKQDHVELSVGNSFTPADDKKQPPSNENVHAAKQKPETFLPALTKYSRNLGEFGNAAPDVRSESNLDTSVTSNPASFLSDMDKEHHTCEWHLVLCSSTDGAARQLSDACKNTLKCLCTWLNSNSILSDCRGSHLSKSADLPFDMLSQGTEDEFMFQLVPAGGYFEFLLCEKLQEVIHTSVHIDPYVSSACNALTETLIEIPRTIFENSYQTKCKRFVAVHSEVVDSMKSGSRIKLIDVTSGEVKSLQVAEQVPLEAISSKYLLICHAVETVQLLLRIDGIISAKTLCSKSNSKFENDSDDD